MFRNNALSIALCIVLTACGGGSSSSNASGGASNNTTNNNTNSNTGTNTSKNTFTVVAKYKDACGNETLATDAALLIHNSDYSNKEIIHADANGKLTYQTDNDKQTLSIVMRGSEIVEGVKPLVVTTYIDHPIKDIGDYYYSTNDTSACDCQLGNFVVNVPARAGEIGSARFSGFRGYSSIVNEPGSNSYLGAEYCKSSDGSGPVVSAIVNYKNPNEAFAAIISDFSFGSDNEVSVEAMLTGQSVEIVSNASNRQVSAYIGGKSNHLTSYAFNGASNVYAFDSELIDFYAVSAYQFEDIYGLPDVENAFLLTLAEEISKDTNKSFDLPVPTVDYTELFAVIAGDNNHYDFSGVWNVDYLSVHVRGKSNDAMVLDWFLYAPASGTAPKIENIDLSTFISDDLLESMVNNVEIDIAADDYQGINGYQDYLNNLSQRKTDSLTNEKWSKYQFIWLSFSFNDIDFSQL